jgi:hypothetical protein
VGIDPSSEAEAATTDSGALAALQQEIAELREALAQNNEILQQLIQGGSDGNITEIFNTLIAEITKKNQELSNKIKFLEGKFQNMETDVAKCVKLMEILGKQNKNPSKASNVVSSNLNYETIEDGIRNGSRLSERCRGLPENLMSRLREIEQMVEAGRPYGEIQERLNQIRDEVAQLEDEAGKSLPRITFSGLHEWFQNDVVLLYLVEQFRNGKNPNLPPGLKAIDQELISAIRNMVDTGATIAEIKKSITFIIDGQPEKTVEPPMEAPTLLPSHNTNNLAGAQPAFNSTHGVFGANPNEFSGRPPGGSSQFSNESSQFSSGMPQQGMGQNNIRMNNPGYGVQGQMNGNNNMVNNNQNNIRGQDGRSIGGGINIQRPQGNLASMGQGTRLLADLEGAKFYAMNSGQVTALNPVVVNGLAVVPLNGDVKKLLQLLEPNAAPSR